VRARLRTSTTGPPTLDVDSRGDGSYATVVAPTFTSAGAAAADVEPPTVAISAVPAGGQDVVVTVTASDTGSGLGAVRYSLGGDVFQAYGGPFRVDSAQFPLVRAFADDVAGNRAPVVTQKLK
jgi:hypothetical protein